MTEEEYKLALKRVEEIYEAEHGTPEGEELDKLIDAIIEYEDEHFPMEILPIQREIMEHIQKLLNDGEEK